MGERRRGGRQGGVGIETVALKNARRAGGEAEAESRRSCVCAVDFMRFIVGVTGGECGLWRCPGPAIPGHHY